MKYRREIDGLRALAVVPVILFHAGFQFFSGGFIGVDIFFVISGYLITTIIIAELDTKSFSIIKFYERRARRILPALFLVLFTCIPFAWLWLFPPDMKKFSQSLIAVSTFSSNIFFGFTGGYFDPAAELNPLLHTWSLAVEEQFYVFFPVFLLLTWGLGKRNILILLSLVFVVSLVLAQIYVFKQPVAAFYLLPSRGWELLVGAFVAFYLAHPKNAANETNETFVSHVGSLAGLALIVFSIFYFDKTTPFPSIYTLVPTVGAALIILYSTPKTWAGKILGTPLFVGIGLISYSAYLWHQPIFAFARYIFLDRPSAGVMLFLTCISFFLAYFGWRFVEAPFRNKQRVKRKTIFTYGIVLSVSLIVFGSLGSFSKGFEGRLPYSSRDLMVFGKPVTFLAIHSSDSSCRDLLGLSALPEEVCVANSKSPQIMFAGDSHAMALYSSIYGKQFDLNSVLISGYSCPLYPNLTYIPSFKNSFGNTCTGIANEVLNAAKKIDSIKVVVLVNYHVDGQDARFSYYLHGKHISSDEAFIAGNDFLVNELLKLGKKVVYFIDVPHLKIDPRFCLQKLPYSFRLASDSGLSRECSITKEENEQVRKEYVGEVLKVKSENPKMLIFDPASYFCTGHYCNFRDGYKSLYSDTHHVSLLGSMDILNVMRSDGLIDH
ncbi:acyltransferase family protein [Silvimonas sp.]|uniref:acyltransferase family protein n=1 Tax=Silvimonas sp. TaxID=2650811 RepID=UPI00284BA038|nr:acyltransferase family protein [Silvimonas sp.]MDR3426466.1 acyltransferase family protein [Silvimonas sp.]